MFMEVLDQGGQSAHWMTLTWLVALGLLNSVISAFYYVRVLRAMFLRPTRGTALRPPTLTIRLAVVGATIVCVLFGLYPTPLETEANRLADSRMFKMGSERAVATTSTAPSLTLAPRDSSAPPEPTPLPDRPPH